MAGTMHAVMSKAERRYRERTPRSREAFEKVQYLIPGGCPGGLGYMIPYPLYVQRGEGCHIVDVDGNRLVDMVNADWLLPLGYGNELVEAAMHAQIAKGTTYCQPDPDLGYEFARLLQQRFPAMERMRFTASGTEATMMALRLARVFTGRGKVAKVRGGYHGIHDVSMVANGRYLNAQSAPDGLIPGTAEHVTLLPFNDPDGVEALIEADKDVLAAVIVEPMLGGSGMIPGTPEYLQRLRDVTARHGIVLIFDEVVTGTLGLHGAQGAYGIRPDMTTLGKAIGGGTPLGAFGGRADIMSLLDQALHPYPPPVRHASTLGGIPLCLAAGLAQMQQLTPELHAHLDALGDRLRTGVTRLAKRYDIPLQVTGMGQFFGLHWTPDPVVDFSSFCNSQVANIRSLVLSLCNEGYFLFYFIGHGVLSAPMTNEHIDGFVAALENALHEAELVG
jgi:glutamate-1-semialdehyde 2,1-aminomutase